MYHIFKLVFVSILTSLFITGCLSLPTEKSQFNQSLTYQFLESYKWELVDAKNADGETISQLFIDPNKPLILNFVAIDGVNILALENTCNKFSADYTIENGELNISDMASTLMACPDTLANFDATSANIIMGKYSLGYDTNNTNILTITNEMRTAHFKAITK